MERQTKAIKAGDFRLTLSYSQQELIMTLQDFQTLKGYERIFKLSNIGVEREIRGFIDIADVVELFTVKAGQKPEIGVDVSPSEGASFTVMTGGIILLCKRGYKSRLQLIEFKDISHIHAPAPKQQKPGNPDDLSDIIKAQNASLKQMCNELASQNQAFKLILEQQSEQISKLKADMMKMSQEFTKFKQFRNLKLTYIDWSTDITKFKIRGNKIQYLGNKVNSFLYLTPLEPEEIAFCIEFRPFMIDKELILVCGVGLRSSNKDQNQELRKSIQWPILNSNKQIAMTLNTNRKNISWIIGGRILNEQKLPSEYVNRQSDVIVPFFGFYNQKDGIYLMSYKKMAQF